jgi:hypothetical protein
MSSRYDNIKINPRPLWAVGKGHNAHRSGGGVHGDRRTRRLRTRHSQVRRAVEED